MLEVEELGLLVFSEHKGTSGEENGKCVDLPVVDIVAVHGLGGHPRETWRSQDRTSTWLEEILAPRISPMARIMSFGYESVFPDSSLISASGIRKTALQLQRELVTRRSGSKAPVVFLAHGFGGVIVKQLLLSSNTGSEDIDPNIASDTEALIFFGTPHHPRLDGNTWDDIIFDMAYALPKRSRHARRDLVTSVIKTGSTAWVDVCNSFLTFAANYVILDFYESSELEDSVVVPETAATLPIFRERSMARNLSHIELCQITDRADGAIDLISGIVNDIVEGFQMSYMECRRTLCSFYLDPSPRKVVMPQTGTLQWIKSHPTFITWFENRAPALLHIYGRPGIGKTVLSNFLIQTLQEINPRKDASSTSQVQPIEGENGSESAPTDLRKPATVISYYFDKSDTRRRNFKHLLLSLIRQLLFRGKSMYEHVSHLHSKFTKRETWSEEDLWVAFRAMVTCEQEAQVICVIDAVDECVSRKGKLIEDLMRLQVGTDTPFKMVLLSQEEKLDSRLQHVINLDQEEDMKKDMNLTIKCRVEALLSRSPKSVSNVVERFCSHDLTHLESSLVLANIEKDSVKHVLAQLEERYKWILEASSPASIYEQVVRTSLQQLPLASSHTIPWILYAEYPLSIAQLMLGEQLLRLDNAESARALSLPDPGACNVDEEVLVEHSRKILRNTPLVYMDDGPIRFIHSTAKDFIAAKFVHTFKIIRQHDAQLRSHCALARACLKYLLQITFLPSSEEVQVSDKSFKDFSRSRSAKHQFLGYASQCWPEHFRKAGKEGVELLPLLREFVQNEDRVGKWIERYHDLEPSPLRCARIVEKREEIKAETTDETKEEKAPHPITEDTSNDSSNIKDISLTPLLDIAACHGLTEVVAELLPGKTKAEKYNALELAAENGWANVVTVILQQTEDAMEAAIDSKALWKACMRGHEDVVGLLLALKAESIKTPRNGLNTENFQEQNTTGAIEVAEDKERRTNIISRCLSIAAENGHARVIRRLIEAGGNVSWCAETECKRTPLMLAAQNGYDLAVLELLDANADIEAADKDQFRALHLAAKNDHLETVRTLLARGANTEGGTAQVNPIHLAASNGNLPIVKELRKYRADLEALDNRPETIYNGKTPLHEAAEQGHTLVVAELLDAGVEVSPVDKGENRDTPLHLAAKLNHLEVVEKLLTAGVDTNPAAKDRYRPLHYAAENGYTSVVRKLLENGAAEDPTLETSKATPLHLACYFTHQGCVDLLLEYGADVHRKASPGGFKGATPLHISYDSLSIMKSILDSGAEIDAFDDRKDTALILSVLYGYSESVKFLIERGADINVQSEDGFTALLTAIERERRDLWELLLAAGADVTVASDKDRTALYFAAQQDDTELVKKLLDMGAQVNKVDSYGWLPLHLATWSGQERNALLLLEQEISFDINAEIYESKSTALHLAAESGMTSVIEKLLDKGANVDHRDKDLWTPLHYAIRQDELEAVRTFLRRGADVNARDKDCWTALHYAARFANETEIFKLLLEHGAKTNTVTQNGKSVLTLAVQYSKMDNITFLVEKLGADIYAADSTFWTPLQWAAARGSEGDKIVEFLVEKAKSHATNKPSALQIAASRGHMYTIGHLKDPINQDSDFWGSALQIATQHRQDGLVERLLEDGADPNSTDAHGWTPYLCAVQSTKEEELENPILKQLVTAGARQDNNTTKPPTSWVAVHENPDIKISNNSLDVVYEVPENVEAIRISNPFPCLVRANHPVPFGCHSYYFEVTIIDSGRNNSEIAIGFDNGLSCPTTLPGWVTYSWAYHGDNGRLYSDGDGKDYSDKCSKGDVIGCGLDPSGSIFFTKNGVNLGIAYQVLLCRLFPVIGLRTWGGHVRAHFDVKYPVASISSEPLES